ncbi:MFS transporter [Streptomyces sp. NPDC088725]|uniref:MFS transporter n=1 Tax=Streptomyces sp. NPDC088725 TaxID=3365873 RepID=UPI00381A1CA1
MSAPSSLKSPDTGLPAPGRNDHVGHRRPRGVPQASHGLGFWFAAVSFAALIAFGTAPTPLWPLYEARDGFGATTVTVAFAVIVIGTALGFLGLGHLSDRYGRRRIVVPALAVAIAAALVLTFWTALPGLLVGRFLNGVGIGLMASTATTYLHDLYHQAHPDRPKSAVPGIVATSANLGGLALGPLISGVIAQWVPNPLTTTQLGFAIAMTIALVLSLSTPETVDRIKSSATRPARFALRSGGRPAFISALALGFFSFALFGLVGSLGPLMLHSKLEISSLFIAGIASAMMYASATVAQLALGKLSAGRLLAVGATVFPIGLGLVALSLYEPTLWIFLLAVSVAGAGAGILFKGGVVKAVSVAAPASRAGVLAVYFVVGYLGMGLFPIVFSIIIKHLSMETTMIGFAAVLSVGAALSSAAGSRHH